MPQVKLYINNEIMDLSGDEDISVDYAIFDISKIGKRGGARSYEFKLPKTNTNKTILENPEIVNNLSTVPYTRLPCKVLVDGVDVLIRFAEVSSVKEGYNLRVYGGNADIFNEIKDLKLSVLDLSEYNHFWTLDNIAENLNNNAIDVRTAYIYGLIDFHADSPNAYINNDNRTMRIDFLLPSVFINIVLERIFEGIGYTLINEIESETEDIVLPFSNWTRQRNTDGGRYIGEFSGIFGGPLSDFGPNINILFNAQVSGQEAYWVPWFAAGSVGNFVLADTCTVTYTFTFEIVNTSGGTLSFFLNASGEIVNISALPGTNNYSLTFTHENISAISFSPYAALITSDLTLSDGYTLSIDEVIVEEAGEIDFNPGVDFTYNYITLSTILPNLTQMDLVKDYMAMFCLLPIVNEFTNEVRLIKFAKILSNIYQAYDWSEKIDWTEDYELKFISDKYAQNNEFAYKEDGEETKPIGTDGTAIIENGNLEFEKKIIELKFSATNTNLRLVDNLICQIGVFEEGVFKNKKNPRILNVLNKELGGSLSITDDSTTTVFATDMELPVPYFIDEDQTFNLGFANNLLEDYYTLIENVISRFKTISLFVRLSAADISQLDFSRPVYIQKFESYFYISSVKGFSYTESKSTLVELVKLNING